VSELALSSSEVIDARAMGSHGGWWVDGGGSRVGALPNIPQYFQLNYFITARAASQGQYRRAP
jgi:hypothetical protein